MPVSRAPFAFRNRAAPSAAAGFFLLMFAACQPTVEVKAPTEPITINLNVKLDAEVRVKLEKQAEEDIRKHKDIF